MRCVCKKKGGEQADRTSFPLRCCFRRLRSRAIGWRAKARSSRLPFSSNQAPHVPIHVPMHAPTQKRAHLLTPMTRRCCFEGCRPVRSVHAHAHARLEEVW
eukprot:6183939-Pleurochrysis_carterae.AAC.2